MKPTARLMFISMAMILAAPAYSSQVAQVYSCEQDDDATEQDLRGSASEWLKAAKTMKGGENLEVTLYFPIAVGGTGETDFLYVINAPSIAEWGMSGMVTRVLRPQKWTRVLMTTLFVQTAPYGKK
jgi:hypothetical protein